MQYRVFAAFSRLILELKAAGASPDLVSDLYCDLTELRSWSSETSRHILLLGNGGTLLVRLGSGDRMGSLITDAIEASQETHDSLRAYVVTAATAGEPIQEISLEDALIEVSKPSAWQLVCSGANSGTVQHRGQVIANWTLRANRFAPAVPALSFPEEPEVRLTPDAKSKRRRAKVSPLPSLPMAALMEDEQDDEPIFVLPAAGLSEQLNLVAQSPAYRLLIQTTSSIEPDVALDMLGSLKDLANEMVAAEFGRASARVEVLINESTLVECLSELNSAGQSWQAMLKELAGGIAENPGRAQQELEALANPAAKVSEQDWVDACVTFCPGASEEAQAVRERMLA